SIDCLWLTRRVCGAAGPTAKLRQAAPSRSQYRREKQTPPGIVNHNFAVRELLRNATPLSNGTI
ncbi:hypothetical protein BaRGS_00015725, partial [Batillaria attramentaria]